MTDELDVLPFWFDDGIPAAGASEDELAALEVEIGHRLPDAFAALLVQRDGGVSNYAFHANDLYFTLPGFFEVATLLSAHKAAEHFGTPSGVVAIASSDEAWLGLDYRASEDEPSVVYQASENDELLTVAHSFSSFLTRLVEEE